MGHSHGCGSSPIGDHGKGRRLLIALALNLGITAAEVVGGVVSGSLSLLADAAHNFSDAASVLVSYAAWRIAQKPANRQQTFGFGRAETVGALVNLTTLFVIGLYLLYEATNRLLTPQEVAGPTMLIVGVIALIEDMLAAWVLRNDITSLNIKSTYLHMIADALTTVGVIVAGVAIMIWGEGVAWIDPAITAGIALYIFWHAGHELRETIAILIDSAPDDFDFDGLVAHLRGAPGVTDVHHVHVWRREESKVAIEVHLVLSDPDLGRATALKERLKVHLRTRFDAVHVTIEVELAGHTNHDHSVIPAS